MSNADEARDASDVDDVPAGDLGAGGPAEETGEGGNAQPPGYADEVDPSQGPLAARPNGHLGDLDDPGADPVPRGDA